MMRRQGLAKLGEELGELQQVNGKLDQYPELAMTTDDRACHPDGTNLRHRLEEEIADVQAAIAFVVTKMELNRGRINTRAVRKLSLFQQWDLEGEEE